MAYEAIINRDGIHRVILLEEDFGTYVLVYESGTTGDHPDRDHYQSHLAMAKSFAAQKFGIGETDWKKISSQPYLYIMGGSSTVSEH